MEPPPAVAPQVKRKSRKAHLKELADAKRAKSASTSKARPSHTEHFADDPDYVHDSIHQEDEVPAGEPTAQVGAKTGRQKAIRRKGIERLRGLCSDARAMEAWLSTAQPRCVD